MNNKYNENMSGLGKVNNNNNKNMGGFKRAKNNNNNIGRSHRVDKICYFL